MPTKKTTDTELLLALTDLFQEHGFEGTSLSLIAKATGLKRASLYHRFPGGKTDMALAVLDYSQIQFDEILAPLSASGHPKQRVLEAAQNIEQFYEGGIRSCLMDSLSVGSSSEGRDVITERIATVFEGFIERFERIALDAGATKEKARQVAEDAIVRFEGSLVVARGTGNTAPFKRMLKELPDMLTRDR